MPRASTSPRARRAPHRGPVRTGGGVALRVVVVLVAIGLLPAVAGAEPRSRDQTIGSLRDRAAKIAEELEQLDQRTNALDEQFNNANLELEHLKRDLAENEQRVDAARTALASHEEQAQSLAIAAFVGRDDADASLAGVTSDATEASRRRTYLAARYGDREDVIDQLTASQKDLADREAQLKAQNDRINRKVAELADAQQDLEATIAERKRVQQSVQGELAAALAAEQDRIARETAARAEAEARAAAARAAAARRPQAVAVRTAPTGGGAAIAPVRAETPRAVTPPPAGAPIAVQTAMAQQGDPYRWAASGPDSFDCSGLVMFAYKAAGRSLPHSSRVLRSMTRSISVDELQPGDLVFGGSPVHHVGIYIGGGQMVHAPHSGDVVKVSGIFATSKPVSFGRL